MQKKKFDGNEFWNIYTQFEHGVLIMRGWFWLSGTVDNLNFQFPPFNLIRFYLLTVNFIIIHIPSELDFSMFLIQMDLDFLDLPLISFCVCAGP